MSTQRRRGRSAAVLVTALLLTGCGVDGDSTVPLTDPATTTEASVDAGIVLVDGWAKAADETGPDSMTGVFGTLHNTTEEPVRLTGGSASVARTVELHKTVMVGGALVMREAQGGFVIEPGQSLVLEPGGNHIMLMGLSAAVEAGTDVDITLIADDGAHHVLVAAARTFGGAQETYAPGHATEEHADHDSGADRVQTSAP